MTEHVTIPMDAEHLEQARREARMHGVSLETYLSQLIQGSLPALAQPKPSISAIFGIGASAEPTDISHDKDSMLSDAVWNEHLRKTQTTE